MQTNAPGAEVLNFASTATCTSPTSVSLGALVSVQMLVTDSIWGALLLPVFAR
jgi:hypothetical protein